MRIRFSADGAVDCRALLKIPLSASVTWGQVRDFHTFAAQEFFHARIDIDGDTPRSGACLRITHRFFIFRVHRVGRICRWKEGVGFAFSDLSARGLQTGFPHVFGLRLSPTSNTACELEIRVAGKWTARLVPRWAAWLWLRWIMQFAAQRIDNELLMYRLWQSRRTTLQPPNQRAAKMRRSEGRTEGNA